MSTTTNKDIEKPAYNSYIDSWNTPTNANFDIIDAAFGATTSLNATAGNATLTAGQYQSLFLSIAGAIAAPVTYTIPSGVGGQWIVFNGTTDSSGGPHAITIASAGGGTSVTVTRGIWSVVTSNGTDMRKLGYVETSSLPISVANGGTGLTTLTANNVILGNGTSSPTFVAPGTTGNVLTSNGTTWTSALPPGGVTSIATGTGLTGGPITTTGTISLANTAVTPGSYGSATQVATITVDAQGRITAASNATISAPSPTITIFASTTTWVCPAGVTKIIITCVGGGGGGAYYGGVNFPSGGYGGYGISIVTVTPGTTYTVTIGSGGNAAASASANGSNGGESWFGVNSGSKLISATGGGGGLYNASIGTPGTPGTSTGNLSTRAQNSRGVLNGALVRANSTSSGVTTSIASSISISEAPGAGGEYGNGSGSPFLYPAGGVGGAIMIEYWS